MLMHLVHSLHLLPETGSWATLFLPKPSWLEKLIRPLIVYLFLLVAFRFSGKRELGQATLFDFLIVLLISNVVQNAMIGEDNSIGGAFGGVAVLLTLSWMLNRVTARSRKVRLVLEGAPTLLVHDGVLIPSALKKEAVSNNDLLCSLREQGIASLQEVRYAVLELDGRISVIRRDAAHPETSDDCVVDDIRRQRPASPVSGCLRRAFSIPWHDRGDWVWEYLPDPHAGCLLFAAPPHGRDGPRRSRLAPYAAELSWLIRRRYRLRDFDIVFAWELRSALAVALLRRLQGARRTRFVAVGPILKGDARRLSRPIGRLLDDAERIVCFSTAECATSAALLGLPTDRFVFWPTPWRIDGPPSGVDEGYILALGRSNRDYPTLFRALAGASIPTTVVAGSEADLAGATLPSEVSVRYNTDTPTTDRLVAAARFHAIPLHAADYSSGQTVLLRAMAAGKACIVTDIPAIRDYVLDDRTALLVPPSDPAALRDALERLWSDAALRDRLGTAARERVAAEFSLERFAGRAVSLAEELCR